MNDEKWKYSKDGDVIMSRGGKGKESRAAKRIRRDTRDLHMGVGMKLYDMAHRAYWQI